MGRRVISGRSKDSGFILITVLAFVVVLTLVALMAMPNQVSQIRGATGAANSRISFETAEGALRLAEQELVKGTYKAYGDNANGLYDVSSGDPIQGTGSSARVQYRWTTTTWGNSDSIQSSFIGGSSQKPRFIIEKLPFIHDPSQGGSIAFDAPRNYDIYRITVRAVGADGGSPTILQSVFIGLPTEDTTIPPVPD